MILKAFQREEMKENKKLKPENFSGFFVAYFAIKHIKN